MGAFAVRGIRNPPLTKQVVEFDCEGPFSVQPLTERLTRLSLLHQQALLREIQVRLQKSLNIAIFKYESRLQKSLNIAIPCECGFENNYKLLWINFEK